jgi:superoxide reductase
MKRRTAILNTAGLAGLSAFASIREVSAQAGTAAKSTDKFGSHIIGQDQEMGKEKHVPMIDAPAAAKAGDKISVTVTVGKVVAHPNTVEHHIQSLELYALEDGTQNLMKIGAVDLGPTLADPKVTFTVMLKASTTLYALSYCNIHGVWDYAVKVKI